MYKTLHVRATFGGLDVLSRGRRKGLCTFSKVSKTWGGCRISKNDGRRGTFEEDPQRYISRRVRSTRGMFIRDVRRSGRWFPEKGCILEHQIFRFAKMILRDRHSTSYDLASIFRGRRSTLDMLGPLLDIKRFPLFEGRRNGFCTSWKVTQTYGFCSFWNRWQRVGHLKNVCKDAFRVAGTVQGTSPSDMLGGQGADCLRGIAFWSIRSSGLLRWFCVTGAALRMTLTFCWQSQCFRDIGWKDRKTYWHEAISSALNFQLLNEVSQNCFVFDVVKFKNWGRVAELLRFWCCQGRSLAE